MRWGGIAAVLVAALGCGGATSPGDGDADVSDDGSVAIDASTPPPDAPPPRRVALSFVQAYEAQVTHAQFRSDTEGPDSCLIEQVGDCFVQTCMPGDPATPFPHGGRLTVESPLGEITLDPEADGHYNSVAGIEWNTGDAVRFRAEGDTVPAFDETVPGPADLDAVLEPDLRGPLTIDREQPLQTRWTGGGSDTVHVALVETSGTRPPS